MWTRTTGQSPTSAELSAHRNRIAGMRRPRQPSLFVKAPKMAHGDATRMTEFCTSLGMPLVPWQRDFLERLESASMDEQFAEIARRF